MKLMDFAFRKIPFGLVTSIVCFCLGNLSTREAQIRHEVVRRYREKLDREDPVPTTISAQDHTYSIPECRDSLAKMDMEMSNALEALFGNRTRSVVWAFDVKPELLHVLISASGEFGRSYDPERIGGPGILICPTIGEPPKDVSDFRRALWKYAQASITHTPEWEGHTHSVYIKKSSLRQPR